MYEHDGKGPARRLEDADITSTIGLEGDEDDEKIVEVTNVTRASIFFATPCHAMPLYSYLHLPARENFNLEAAFLDCLRWSPFVICNIKN